VEYVLGEIDLNVKPQKPQLSIATPNRSVIGRLPEAFSVKQSLKLGGINELSLSIPLDIDDHHNLVRNKNVDKLKPRYLIKVQDGSTTEWYRIEKITDVADENQTITQITCYSLAIELKDKQIRSYKKDAINAATALTDALSGSIWNTDYIDADYLLTYRSFDVSKATVLDFVLQVATTFNALVIFDTVNRTVNFYKPDNIGQNRGLKVSYGKYLKSLNRENDAGQIVTRLKVFGKDGLSIQSVNPSGANYVEDFSFFMYPFQRDTSRNVISHSSYMSDELCHSLLDYSSLLATKEGDYDPLLEQKNSLVDTKTTKENELSTLNTELANIEAQIDINQSTGIPYADLITQRNAKQAQVNTKQVEIDDIDNDIAVVDGQIAELQSSVSMEENFTVDQIMELNQFIVEGEWSDENYFREADLYAEAKKQIQEFKQPPLLINVDIVNFKEIVTEQRNWDKLNLGDSMTIAYEKFNLNALAKIIEMNFEYDSASVSVVIADVQQILDDQQKFLKTLYSSIQTSASVDMNKFKWNGIETTQNDVSKLLNETWDATARNIKAGVDESVLIDRRGITITDPSDPLNLVRMNHSYVALSTDGGNTFKNAITPPGITGELIIGKILAGEKLVIENENGSFFVGPNEVSITDLNLAITRSDGKTRILASPNSGFSIQKLQNTTWTDKLYADFDGILHIEDLVTKRILIKDGDDNVLIDGVNKIIDFSKFTTIAGELKVGSGGIQMTGAITWGTGGVTPPTASQVGALSSGTFIPDANYITTITEDTITTTNVIAANLQVNAANIAGDLVAARIRNTADPTDYAIVGGANGGLILYRSGNQLFEIYGGLEGLTMKSTGLSFLSSTGTTTYAERNWDFTTATSVKFNPSTITGITSEAVFG
jgi:phage minor structural protein